MDSILVECEALGLVVFSNIIYLFIHYINDIILTAFHIILSTCTTGDFVHENHNEKKMFTLSKVKFSLGGTNEILFS